MIIERKDFVRYNPINNKVSMTSIPTNYNYANDRVRYKYLEKMDVSPEFPNKRVEANVKKFMLRRNRLSRETNTADKIQAATGAIIGTVVPLLFMMKKQGVKNPFKLEYGLKEMLVLSGAPIVGGVSVGMLGNDNKTNLNKSKEGVFQFLNAAIPTWLAAAVLKWCDGTKGMKNGFAKFSAIAATILIGMHGAASLSNIICDPKDKHPDRKLTLLDSLANIDDLFGILVLAKVPIVGRLHLDKILPAIYAFCGYRAGKSN